MSGFIRIIVVLLTVSFIVVIVLDSINFFDYISSVSKAKKELKDLNSFFVHDYVIQEMKDSIQSLNRNITKIFFEMTFKTCVFVLSLFCLNRLYKKHE